MASVIIGGAILKYINVSFISHLMHCDRLKDGYYIRGIVMAVIDRPVTC